MTTRERFGFTNSCPSLAAARSSRASRSVALRDLWPDAAQQRAEGIARVRALDPDRADARGAVDVEGVHRPPDAATRVSARGPSRRPTRSSRGSSTRCGVAPRESGRARSSRPTTARSSRRM